MLWALIVPELVLAWAIRQWMAAKMIEEEFKGESVILLKFRFSSKNIYRAQVDEESWSFSQHGRVHAREFWSVDSV